MRSPREMLVLVAATLSAAALSTVCVGGLAVAASATKVVSYRGHQLVVPADWPVYHLDGDPTGCVRFDRHAVYLGQPGAEERCPAHAAGRTEAILVQSLAQTAAAGGARALAASSVAGSDARAGSFAQVVDHAHGVVVTATWSGDPAVISRALGVRSLSRVAAASRAQPSALPTGPASEQAAPRAMASASAAPGGVFIGEGFDTCSTPSSGDMSAWGSSPYGGIGVYIGGTNMACSQGNLTSGWVKRESAAGWHLLPIYVGLQAPYNSCGCASIDPGSASSEGHAAADDAVAQARSIGLGTGNPIFFDMEGYAQGGTNTSAVLTFLAAWGRRLHADGYKSGVYSSDDSGISDLVSQWGTGYSEPDQLWIANWNGQHTTSDPNVPSYEWSHHQRVHQHDGGHDDTYGGVPMNIDGDSLNASTAAFGSSTVPPPAPVAGYYLYTRFGNDHHRQGPDWY